jgi:metal-responsive CopG/Arc/MetJ family transcriptional regulator
MLYVIIMRTIIDIPDAVLQELDALTASERISRAEAIRRAIAQYLEKRPGRRSDAAFGIWKSRKIDPLDYEDSVRGEWNR